ncbi:hypothetical protein ACKFKG_22060 [Phormidesmis sp. 146-35]
MYVFFYTTIIFGLAYFHVLTQAEHLLTNVLVFGGAYLGFIVVRFILLKAMMPAPAPLPPAPNPSVAGSVVGSIADLFFGTGGLGTAFGGGWDEAENAARAEGYLGSVQQWTERYENEVVAPRLGAALIGIFLAFFSTLGCAYSVGVRLW